MNIDTVEPVFFKFESYISPKRNISKIAIIFYAAVVYFSVIWVVALFFSFEYFNSIIIGEDFISFILIGYGLFVGLVFLNGLNQGGTIKNVFTIHINLFAPIVLAAVIAAISEGLTRPLP